MLRACEPRARGARRVRDRTNAVGQDLDRDVAVQPSVARAVHLAHPARADHASLFRMAQVEHLESIAFGVPDYIRLALWVEHLTTAKELNRRLPRQNCQESTSAATNSRVPWRTCQLN